MTRLGWLTVGMILVTTATAGHVPVWVTAALFVPLTLGLFLWLGESPR